MPCEFLSGLTKLPFPAASVIATAGTLGASTLYLFLTARNRAGWTVASDPIVRSIAANTGITVSVPLTARGIGTNFLRYSLCAGTTNDPIQSRQIAEWETYFPDGTTIRPFNPIELKFPSQILLAPTIATPAALPTGNQLVNGMHRLISGGLPNNAIASYYKYSAYESRPVNAERIIEPVPGEKWVRVLSPYTGQFTDPFGIGGCAADVRSIDPQYISLPPDYNPNQINPVKGVPIALTWRNDSVLPLKAGTNFGLEFRQGDENRTDIFNGKAIVTFRGFTDGLGGLDKLDNGGVSALPWVDIDRIWSYGDDALGILTLDKDLPPGRSVVYEIAPYFTAQQFNGNLASGELISTYLYPYSQSGKNVAALAAVTGDLVLPIGNRLHVLPKIGAGVKIDRGSAIVKGYVFSEVGEQSVFGLAINTNNQKIVLDGNGVCSLRATPLGSEVVLAIVSTEIGSGRIGALSPAIVVAANGKANLSLNYQGRVDDIMPIRSNYPIIGGDLADFNPPFLDLYAVKSGVFYRALSGGTNRISTIPTSVVIDAISASIPAPIDPTDPLFDLFSPPSIAVVAAAAGTIPAGNYRFFGVYHYDGTTASKIDRAGIDVIRESTLSLADLYLLNQGWGRPVYSLSGFRSLSSEDTFPWQQRSTIGGAIYYYDPDSIEIDNSTSIFKPDYLLTSNPGRWIKGSGGGGSSEWITVSGGGVYLVPDEGGKLSIDSSANPTTVVLPLSPIANTEVSYQIVDTTAKKVSIEPEQPNRIADRPIGNRGYHSPLVRRSDIETLRFVGDRWIPSYDKLLYESILAIPPLVASGGLAFGATATISFVPISQLSGLIASGSIALNATATIAVLPIVNITVSPVSSYGG
jgi:hypothetical protein